MNDEQPQNPKRDPLKLRNTIARNLREIEHLAVDLHTQALNTPNARDFPGGTALHMLAPAVALQDWEAQYENVEETERWDANGRDRWEKRPKLDPATYQGDDTDQPLNVVATWTRKIREILNQPTGLASTLSRDIDYLRGQLDRICAVDERGDALWPLCFTLADDLRTLVRRMEDTLRAGDRIDTDAAPCFLVDVEGNRCGGTLARINRKPKACAHMRDAEALAEWLDVDRLTAFRGLMDYLGPKAERKHRQCGQGGRDDLYRCLDCEKIYTEAEYWLAVREHHERQTAQ